MAAPLSSGVTYNRFNSQISTNVSWSNKEIPVSGFSDFEYSISYTPALEKVVAKPLATDLLGPICDDRFIAPIPPLSQLPHLSHRGASNETQQSSSR